jgi:hypothetical protein
MAVRGGPSAWAALQPRAALGVVVTWTGIAACWAIVDSCSPLLAGRQSVGAASVTGIDNFLDAAAIHPERDCATPITPVEIDGATQVWESSPRYAPFRAPAFPSPGPCRSRCRALASLARARTSDDIRPRALCTPPPKSICPYPGPLHPANIATGNNVWSASFRARGALPRQ